MFYLDVLLPIIVFIILCTFECTCAINSEYQDHKQLVVVETSLGKILGYHQQEHNLNVFLGIPYAEPPIGRFRFRPPRPKRSWYPSIYRALAFSPECLQSSLYTGDDDPNNNNNNNVDNNDQIEKSTTSHAKLQDEDCLYLNIWQPASAGSNRYSKDEYHNTNEQHQQQQQQQLYPVMIWIYGGAFLHGGASRPEYYGNKLASKGIVLVSFNYRLGALGFLVSTADGLYGNYGLDDQKTAIQWVKDNIRAFNGDPDRITLFGESAGAMSIGLHVLDQQHNLQREQRRTKQQVSPTNPSHYTDNNPRIFPNPNPNSEEQYFKQSHSNKLFHGVILQSDPLGYKYRSIAVANFIGSSYKQQLDCEDLRCLQSESPEELMHVQDTLMAVPRSIGDFFTWGPVLTDTSYFREARLRPGPLSNITVRQPIEALKEISRLDIPFVIGTTSHEGTVFVFTAYPTRMTKIIYQALVISFFRTSSRKVLRMYAPLVRKLERTAFPDYRLVLARIIGDYLFRCPNQFFASQLTTIGASVFYYEFSLATRTPGFPCCDGLACHTCELPYVFNHIDIIKELFTWDEGDMNSNSHNYNPRDKDNGEESSIDNPSTNSFPDIFGAASNWLGDALAQNIGGPIGALLNNGRISNGNKTKLRLDIDTEVSNMISEYWIRFSKFGDPNGLYTRDPTNLNVVKRESFTDIHSIWWPKILGDLPTNLQNTAHTKDRSRNNDVIDLIPEEEEDDDEYKALMQKDGYDWSADYYSSLADEQYLLKEANKQLNMDENLDFLLHNKNPTDYNYGLKTKQDRKHSYKDTISNKDLFLNQKYMHQMIFDDDSSVHIFEKDCICNNWNLLEYRF